MLGVPATNVASDYTLVENVLLDLTPELDLNLQALEGVASRS